MLSLYYHNYDFIFLEDDTHSYVIYELLDIPFLFIFEDLAASICILELYFYYFFILLAR